MSGAITDCGALTSGSTGAGGAHNNMMPYLVVNYIIRYAPEAPPVPEKGFMTVYNEALPVSQSGHYFNKVRQTSWAEPVSMYIQFIDESWSPLNIPENFDWKDEVSWTRVSYSPNIWKVKFSSTTLSSPLTNRYIGQGNYFGEYRVIIGNLSGCSITGSIFPFSEGPCRGIDFLDLRGVSSARALFSGCAYKSSGVTREEATSTFNILTNNSLTDCYQMFASNNLMASVNLFNTNNVTTMVQMFEGCTYLSSVPDFNTSNVQSFFGALASTGISSAPNFDLGSCVTTYQMFYDCVNLETTAYYNLDSVRNATGMYEGCTGLRRIGLFPTDYLEDVSRMFYGCINVEEGALALYQQMSSQTTPPGGHTYCFTDCGSNTTTGAAELAQIPTSWGGTGE